MNIRMNCLGAFQVQETVSVQYRKTVSLHLTHLFRVPNFLPCLPTRALGSPVCNIKIV